MEIKQVRKGQLGEVGVGVAGIHTILRCKMKPQLHEPIQVCVRIETETKERLDKYCSKVGIKPVGLAGLILNVALQEFCSYVDSLEAEETAFKEAENAAMEEEAKKPRSKRQGKIEPVGL